MFLQKVLGFDAKSMNLRTELIAGGWLKEKQKKKPGEKTSQPFSFKSPDGSEILVGKNNYQNDRAAG